MEPSAINSVSFSRSRKTEAELNYHAASVHVVYEVVAQRNTIGELIKTEWYHNLVLLKLRERRSSECRIENVNGDDTRLRRDLILELGRRREIRIDDEHP
jgi:hypothetical protein